MTESIVITLLYKFGQTRKISTLQGCWNALYFRTEGVHHTHACNFFTFFFSYERINCIYNFAVDFLENILLYEYGRSIMLHAIWACCYLPLLVLWMAPSAVVPLPLVYSGCLGVANCFLPLSMSRTSAMVGRLAGSNWVHSSPISKHLFISVSWDSLYKDRSNRSSICLLPRIFQAWEEYYFVQLARLGFMFYVHSSF